MDKNTYQQIGRAVDELRRLGGIRLESPSGLYTLLPPEMLDEAIVAQVKAAGNGLLLLTGARAKAAGLAADDKGVVTVDITSLSLADIQALADPLAGKPPSVKLGAASEELAMVLTLARHASLLPALLAVKIDQSSPLLMDAPVVPITALRDYIQSPAGNVIRTAEAKLPMMGAEDACIISFRQPYSSSVHLAIIIGKPEQDETPLVRIHSSCLTGDILGSLRCDCGEQLQMALSNIIAAGSGMILYLHQEGRGIGITNKLKAYALQEQGVDTYDANRMLGFEEDERDFAIAAGMLKSLGINTIRLMTNNPKKIESLRQHGIATSERVGVVSPSGKHNHAYLGAKAKKAGHLF